MIVSAAVKIKDLRQDKEIIIPCHRHCDVFYILKEFGYCRRTDFEEIAQGFLDNEDNFYTRSEAAKYMRDHYQKTRFGDFPNGELYSEDLW